MHSSLRGLVNLEHLPFHRISHFQERMSFLLSLSHADVQASQWWICNYWWLHRSSELLQSAGMVIVTEVICIKLIILCNKAHKSGHYQFGWKCFKCRLLHRLQGKREGFPPSFFYQIRELIFQGRQRHLLYNDLTIFYFWNEELGFLQLYVSSSCKWW